jgi:hypothetical protein
MDRINDIQSEINRLRVEGRIELKIQKVSNIFREDNKVMRMVSLLSNFLPMLENNRLLYWNERLVRYLEENEYVLRNDIHLFSRELVEIGEEDEGCNMIIDFLLENCV